MGFIIMAAPLCIILLILATAEGCLPSRAPLVTLTCPAAVPELPAQPSRTATPVAADEPRGVPLLPIEEGPRVAPLPLVAPPPFPPIRTGPLSSETSMLPFTLVVDGRLVGMVPSDADSAA